MGVTQNVDTDVILEENNITEDSLYYQHLGWNGPKSPVTWMDPNGFAHDTKTLPPIDFDFIIRYNPLFVKEKPKQQHQSFLARLDTSLIRKAKRLLSPTRVVQAFTSPTSIAPEPVPMPSPTPSPTMNSHTFMDGFLVLSPTSEPSTSPSSEEEFQDDDDNIGSVYSPTDLRVTTLNSVQKRKFLRKTKSKEGGTVPYQSMTVQQETPESYQKSLHYHVTNFLHPPTSPTTPMSPTPTLERRDSWRDSLDIMKMKKQTNPFLHLPIELHVFIMSFMELSDILNMTLVSLDLCVVCEHDILWKRPCENRGMSTFGVEKRFRKFFVENQIKVCIIGESQVGKSSLQKRLTNNPLQIFESFSPRTQYNTQASYQGESYYLYFGHEACEKQKYLAARWDVVLVCFSTEAFHTLKKAKSWIKTARTNKNNCIILVGLKTDIRTDVLEQNDPEELVGLVSSKEGEDVAYRNKCLGYVEVSSKTKDGFNELVELIIQGKSFAFQGKKALDDHIKQITAGRRTRSPTTSFMGFGSPDSDMLHDNDFVFH